MGLLRSISVLLLSASLALSAQTPEIPVEYQVKASFLLNFTKFVEWPESAHADATSPIRICILGDDPFGKFLEKMLEGENVNKRAVMVTRIHQTPAPKACQVLFVSRSEPASSVSRVLAELGPGVLTIGETKNFCRDGGIIGFVIEDRRVRFDVSEKSAVRSGLKISSQVMRLARQIEK